MLLVIYGLRGIHTCTHARAHTHTRTHTHAHTHTHTHTHMHTCPHESDFKKPGAPAYAAWFKILAIKTKKRSRIKSLTSGLSSRAPIQLGSHKGANLEHV